MDNSEQIDRDLDPALNVSELDVLKSRAKMMGLVFSNNIGLESLKTKIADKMAEAGADEADKTAKPVALADQLVEDIGAPAPVVSTAANALEVGAKIAMQNDTAAPFGADYKPQLDHDGNGTNGGAAPAVEASPQTLRQKQLKEQLRLVRIRIQCLDPKKKDRPGEIITIANEVIGTVRKFVPYGEVTDDGYHVPYIIYRHLEKRKFLNIRTGKDRRTQTPTVTSNWAKEFSIEVLEPLTQEELNRLAAAQAAAGSIN